MVATRTLRTALNNEGMYDPIPIERFGGVAVESVDDIFVTNANSDAIEAAIASVTVGYLPWYPYYKGGPKIKLGYGAYYFSRPIDPDRTIFIEGMCGNSGANSGLLTTMMFPAGSNGIRFRPWTQAGSSPPVVTNGSQYSMLRNLRIQSLGFGGQTTKHGIDTDTVITLDNVSVGVFGGNGINIVADVNISPGSNANLFYMNRCTFVSNAGHGVYVTGGDGNAGNGFAINVGGNGGWGIWDNSFLGNSWFGCHSEQNALGAYKSTDPNARTLWSGCYSEGGQPPSLISPPSLVIGGIHAAGLTGNALYIDGSGSRINSFQVVNPADTANLLMEFRPGTNRLICLTGPGQFSHSIKFDNAFTGAFGWNYADLDGGWSYFLTTSGSIIKCGRSANLAPNKHVYPQSIFLGSDGHPGARELGNADAMPTTGEYARGDFIINRLPVIASGKVLLGWSRLVTGTAHVAGTDWTPIYGTTT